MGKTKFNETYMFKISIKMNFLMYLLVSKFCFLEFRYNELFDFEKFYDASKLFFTAIKMIMKIRKRENTIFLKKASLKSLERFNFFLVVLQT